MFDPMLFNIKLIVWHSMIFRASQYSLMNVNLIQTLKHDIIVIQHFAFHLSKRI